MKNSFWQIDKLSLIWDSSIYIALQNDNIKSGIQIPLCKMREHLTYSVIGFTDTCQQIATTRNL